MTVIQPAVIITGAGRGIGREIARVFAQSGYKLTLVSRSLHELEETAEELAPDVASLAVADVTDPGQCSGAVASAISHAGRLDVLVNAAGIHGAIGPFWDVPLDGWMQAFQVNLLGTLNMIRAAMAHLRVTQGSIINFAGGGDGPMPYFSAYGASKVALIRWTETAAEELRPLGIRMNIVAPGAVKTRLLDNAVTASSQLSSMSDHVSSPNRHTKVVSPRLAAELCLFLASSSSSPLTGKYLSAVWDDWRSWTPEQIAAIASSDRLTLRRKK